MHIYLKCHFHAAKDACMMHDTFIFEIYPSSVENPESQKEVTQ